MDVKNVDGMTLRDWFAGQALAGLCSMLNRYDDWPWNSSSASRQAYRIADAMIAERDKESK